MAKKKISGRPHEERKAKELIDKIAKKRTAKRPKEDPSQAATRIVREATKD